MNCKLVIIIDKINRNVAKYLKQKPNSKHKIPMENDENLMKINGLNNPMFKRNFLSKGNLIQNKEVKNFLDDFLKINYKKFEPFYVSLRQKTQSSKNIFSWRFSNRSKKLYEDFE